MAKLNTAKLFYTDTNRNTPTARSLWHCIQKKIKPTPQMMTLAGRFLKQVPQTGLGALALRIGPGRLARTDLQSFYDLHSPATPELQLQPLFGVDWLGYGYSPYGLLMDWDHCSRAPLFTFQDWGSYTYEGHKYAIPTVAGVIASGGNCTLVKLEEASVQEMLYGFYDEFTAGADFGLFKGELDIGYQSAITNYWEYRTAAQRCQMKLLRMVFTSLNDMPALLTPEAKDDLTKVTGGAMDPNAYFDKWGTHYISGIEIGGEYNLYMRFQKTRYESTTAIDAKVSAAAFGISASNATQIDSAMSELDQFDEMRITAYGGMSFPVNYADLGMNAWQAAVKASPGPVAFWGDQMQGLTPIYTLVQDRSKREMLRRAFLRYSIQHELALGPMGNVVTEIGVGCHSDAPKAKEQARGNGRTLVNVDLNQGAGGDFIYLGKRIQNVPAVGILKPILDLKAVTGSNNVGPPNGYDRYNVDMNKGAGGDYIYLCASTDGVELPLKLPLRDVTVESYDDAKPLAHFSGRDLQPVTEPGQSSPMDFNRGAGGKFIYVLMRR